MRDRALLVGFAIAAAALLIGVLLLSLLPPPDGPPVAPAPTTPSPVAPTAPPATETPMPTETPPATPTPPPATPTPPPTPGPPTPAPTPATGTLADEWQRVPDAPLALTEVAATAHDGEMWLAGGFDGDGQLVPNVLVFDPRSGEWRDGPPLPEALHHATMVSSADALFVLGGYTSRDFSRPTAAVHRLDAASGQWVEGPPLPEPRAAGAAAWDGARIAYAGGVGPQGLAGDIFVMDGNSWRAAGALSTAREHLAATSDGAGTVWFMGGRVRGLAGNLGTVDRLIGDDLAALGEPLTPRSGVAAFWTPLSGPCLAGGEGPDGTFDDVECVADDGSVQRLPPLGVARHGLGAAAFEDGIAVALGGPRPGLFVSAAVEWLAIEP